ncbi:MAG: 4-hydroxybenzoate octaprenyltransferase [Pedosphaera sp.]|nr:4-hydroxybenzoate octaprenyltransferase [Pedosphaera sp.]
MPPLPSSDVHPPSSLFSLIGTWADFVKLSHTVFALPFALASMAVAARENRGWPGWRIFLLILAATVCARTSGMAFNRIVDRKFDAANPRTAARHLPAGTISLSSALVLCVLSGFGLLTASYFINPVCFYLSPIALFIVFFYSLTKRFTDFTHIYLGVALALAPLGAWLAVNGSLAFSPFLLALAVVSWLVGFDIIYAIQDYEFDRRHGLHSLVVRWGVKNALKFAFLCHIAMWTLLALFGLISRFRVAYSVGLFIILGSLILEHWLAHKRNLKWINTAFFRLNALISLIFFIVTVTEVAFPAFKLIR